MVALMIRGVYTRKAEADQKVVLRHSEPRFSEAKNPEPSHLLDSSLRFATFRMTMVTFCTASYKHVRRVWMLCAWKAALSMTE